MPKIPNCENDQEFVTDVEDLLEKAVLEEATQIVWKTFENAMANLDPESRAVLQQHFDGNSAEKICEEKAISAKELELWLQRVKREINENLRRGFNVKQ